MDTKKLTKNSLALFNENDIGVFYTIHIEYRMNTQMREKKTRYVCEICKYKTSNRNDYNRHLSTVKHINTQNKATKDTTPSSNIQLVVAEECLEIKQYTCECGNNYKYHSGLYKHKKTCNNVSNNDLVMNLIKQNEEFKQLMIEQNKTILELSKNQMTVTNSNNNNTTNNKFNLNFFLNEQCKNAINLPDFVNSLKLTISDLEKVGQLGYAEGISRIFVRGLKEMDVFKRPIHCSDAKRETLYVRDKDAWEKEDEEKDKIKVAIRKIAHNNFKQITQWTDEKPEYKKSDTPEYNEWVQIMHQSSGGGNGHEKNYQRIIKNVATATTIEKERS